MKRTSLVRHMILGVMVAELLCAVVLSGLAVTHEMHSRQRAFDVMLRGRADSVLGAIRDAEDAGDNAVLDPNELQIPKQDVYVVLDSSGRLIGESTSLDSAVDQTLSMPRRDDYFGFRSGDARYRGIRLHGVRIVDRDDNGGIRQPVLIVYAAPTRFCGMRCWRQSAFTSLRESFFSPSRQPPLRGFCGEAWRRSRSLRRLPRGSRRGRGTPFLRIAYSGRGSLLRSPNPSSSCWMACALPSNANGS